MRVLISTIGAGGINAATGSIDYSTAKYYCDGKRGKVVESAYIIDALIEFHNIEKCIIVGTSGSHWYAFYERLFSPDCKIPVAPNANHDDEYALELLGLEDYVSVEPKDRKNLRDKAKLLMAQMKSTIGDFCPGIVMLNYGLNQAEIEENFVLLSEAAGFINDKDELYFDITHSFRSLALYEYAAVNYFKDVLKKDVLLKYVSYGMYDFAKENDGLTPVVDLSPLTDVMDFTKAASEYKRFGTASLLADLFDSGRLSFAFDDESKKALRRLGDPMIFSDIGEFINLIKNCERSRMQATQYDPMTELVVAPVLDDLAKRFGGGLLGDRIRLIAELAVWHFEFERYLSAAIILQEFTLEYCAELLEYELKSLSKKELYELEYDINRCLNSAYSPNSSVHDFMKRYRIFKSDIRNNLAHGRPLTSGNIIEFEKYIDYFRGTFKTGFYGMKSTEIELAQALAAQMSIVAPHRTEGNV